jgi:hypothetical protein
MPQAYFTPTYHLRDVWRFPCMGQLNGAVVPRNHLCTVVMRGVYYKRDTKVEMISDDVKEIISELQLGCATTNK